MNEDNASPQSDPPAVDPDDLMAHIDRASTTKTWVISIVFHVLLIGLTSIGFITLCVKHRTLHPKAVVNRQAEEKREAERSQARRLAREKVLKSQPKASGAAATRPKTPIERKVSEVSRQKPTPTTMKLDDYE